MIPTAPVAAPTTATQPDRLSALGRYVAAAHAAGELVVQPRMGFDNPALMRAGLAATRAAPARTVGTITLDSYTRTGDHDAARRALAEGIDLNGYPIVAFGPHRTATMLDGIAGPDFPVQVRHGSAAPYEIFATLLWAGIEATEGGPVSYCLPYSRTPLAVAVDNWARSCEMLAGLRQTGAEPHLETFGGCMLGQLCPPALLVAISILEGLFFRQHGIRSISLSYAQQTNAAQDHEAVAALRQLATEALPDADWHVVLYTYMGVYPRTEAGAHRLLAVAAALAVRSGAARLIVKTAAEAHRIPTIAENVEALGIAADAAARARSDPSAEPPPDTGVLAEARSLVAAVRELSDDVGTALRLAFARGFLDVPWCLHPDNAGRARSYLDADGRLLWSEVGRLPIGPAEGPRPPAMGSRDLMAALSYMQRRFDETESPQ